MNRVSWAALALSAAAVLSPRIAAAQTDYNSYIRDAGERTITQKVQTLLRRVVGEAVGRSHPGQSLNAVLYNQQLTKSVADRIQVTFDPSVHDAWTLVLPRSGTFAELYSRALDWLAPKMWDIDPLFIKYKLQYMKEAGVSYSDAVHSGGRFDFESRFGAGPGVGPDASDAEVARFVDAVTRQGGAVVRASDAVRLPSGAQATTYRDEHGQVTVLLPRAGTAVKRFALLDEAEHVRQLTSYAREHGAAALEKLLSDAALGDKHALAQTAAWEVEARKAVLAQLGASDPDRAEVARSVAALERAAAPLTGESAPREAPPAGNLLQRAGQWLSDFFAGAGDHGGVDRAPSTGETARTPRGVGLTRVLDARIVEGGSRAEGREEARR